MNRVRDSERGKWLVAAALAAGVLSVLTVVLALAAPGRSIPRGVINLSFSAVSDLDSDLASVAVSPDGDRVAVVWVEKIESGSRGGSVWLRWASESTGSGWSLPVSVFAGTEQACAIWSAPVAVTGTTAHVAYVAESPCTGNQFQSVISYTTCHLTGGGSCDVAQTITSTSNTMPPADNLLLSGVDIALDGDGNPHFVYRRIQQEREETIETTSTVYYRGGVSQPDERVPDSGTDGAPGVAWSDTSGVPAIAWSNGYAHVVWEEGTEDGTKFEIMYNRRDITGTWEHPSTPPTSYMGSDTRHPRNPDVAAYGDHVVVTWDWQWTAKADQYVLAYTRYVTSTDKWMYGYEVGTQGGEVDPLIDEGLRDPPYYTYTSMADVAQPAYLHYLRPSIALDRKGLPTVVWHADNGTYDIMYSRAQSMTESAAGDSIFFWSEPAIYNSNSAGDSASPAVAQAPVVSPTLHVAYSHKTGDWETYYEGKETGYTPGDYAYSVFLPAVLRSFASEGDR